MSNQNLIKKRQAFMMLGAGDYAKSLRQRAFIQKINGLSSQQIVEQASLIPNVSAGSFAVVRIRP